MADMADIRSKATKPRAVFTFDIPEEIESEIRSVGLVELTAEEEIEAAQRGSGNNYKVALQLARASLVEVDGKKLDRQAGEDEATWFALVPKVRSLVIEAYSHLHAPGEGAAKSFLKSRKVRVG